MDPSQATENFDKDWRLEEAYEVIYFDQNSETESEADDAEADPDWTPEGESNSNSSFQEEDI